MRLFFKKLGQQRALAVMSVPFLIWLFVFKYLPLWGWSIAFQDYVYQEVHGADLDWLRAFQISVRG